MGTERGGRGSPACSISAMSRSTPSAPIHYALLATNFGLSFWVCLPLARHPRRVLGVLLGFPCCGCAATISPSSRLPLARSSRLVIINWQSLTGGAERRHRHSPANPVRHSALGGR